MPIYEFQCTCGVKFERMVRSGKPDAMACPSCQAQAERVLSDFGFAFGDGKVPGNTGVYSLDTDIDKRIGRDAAANWEYYKDRFARKREVQRDAGGVGRVPVKVEGGDYVPMAPEEVDRFKVLHNGYQKALHDHRKMREAKGIGLHDEGDSS